MRRRLKVFHVLPTLGIGGTELTMAKLIERTGDAIEHHVLCIREAGPTAERLRAIGVGVTALAAPAGNDPRLPLRLALHIRDADPDVVHTRNWGGVDGILAARLAGVRRVVHSEHGRDAADPRGENRRRNVARRLLAPLVAQFVAVSQDLRRWLVERVGIPARKVRVIANGIEPRPPAAPGEVARARAELGGNGGLLVGTVGRLDPVKDQAALLRAASALRARDCEVRLAVVGDGPCREELLTLTHRLGLAQCVCFAGHREDVPRLMPALDVFVLPSLGEGLCNTVLEAMAAGRPVVATNVGGNPECVAAGESGLLVPPSDEIALADAIEMYARDPELRRRHGEEGRRRVAREFSFEKAVEAYRRLYDGAGDDEPLFPGAEAGEGGLRRQPPPFPPPQAGEGTSGW
jgi:sugar transferase (PEP-CTERM/EpsH1 system associated)